MHRQGQGASALRVREVSVASTLGHAKGGQFVTHVKALPGNPYDGHTLEIVIPDLEALIGNIIERLILDKGCRGHNATPEYVQGVHLRPEAGGTPQIKREMRQRSAVEPIISHLISEHRIGRNYLLHRQVRPSMPSSRPPAPASLPLAGALVAPNPRPVHPPASPRPELKSEFFTDDSIDAR